MKLLYLLPFLSLTLALPSPAPQDGNEPVEPGKDIAGPKGDFTASDASTDFPFGTKLSTSIEGASIDAFGTLHAVNGTHLMNLKTGDIIFQKSRDEKADPQTQQFSSSRKLSKDGPWLLGDAAGQGVYTIGNDKKAEESYRADWLQPNDMVVSGNGKNVYFAGNNYGEGTGDVWYSLNKDKPVQIPLHKDMYRANGIELSADDSWLFTTSVKMGPKGSGKIEGASVWKIKIAKDGKPEGDWQQAIDLFKVVGQKFAEEAGMDPDGMRIDINGYMYSTLNAFERVLKWNTAATLDKPETQVIQLKSVYFPTNLELGGPEGKTLYVVGTCKKDSRATSCVDKLEGLKDAGREFTRLNGKLKCKLKKGAARKARRAAFKA